MQHLLQLYFFFMSSERLQVWSNFYHEVLDLFVEVAEKPISATLMLPLFLAGLCPLGVALGHDLKKFAPLV